MMHFLPPARVASSPSAARLMSLCLALGCLFLAFAGTSRATEENLAREIVFIDPGVSDAETLFAGLRTDLECVRLQPGTDGLAQIATHLSTRRDLGAIHIISHGEVGKIQLGSGWLDAAGIASQADVLASIGRALAPEGDILLYGCQVGADGAGVDFIRSLAAATHADVAASTNVTGSARKGGDWVFERQVGTILAHTAFTEVAMTNYASLLQTVAGTINFHVVNPPPLGLQLSDIVTDTDAGATDIPNVTYQIFATDAAGNPNGAIWTYEDDMSGAGHDGIWSNSTYGDPVVVIRSQGNATAFSFQGIGLFDYSGAQAQVRIEGFKVGVSTGHVVLNLTSYAGVLHAASFGPADLPSATFGDVDEVRLTNPNDIPGDYGAPPGSKLMVLALDDINFGDPVSPNTAPSLTATGGTPTFTENGSAVDLFSGVTAAVNDASQTFSGMTMTVTNVSNGASEILTISGTDVALTNGNSGTLTAIGNYSVSVTGGTATVTLSGMTRDNTQMGTLIDGITYRNTSDAPGTNNRVVTITGITDSGSSNNSASPNIAATVTVSAVNDAPVLDSTTVLTLDAINEDAGAPVNGVASGTLVSNVVGGISDPDSGALQGIAIIGVDDSQGTWWFTTNGGTSWSALGTPSASAARLLAADANTRLHFQPNANWNGTLASALTIRGWDRSLGTNGGQANINVEGTGGSTPFSTATDTVSLTVNAANDAPTIGAGPYTLTGTDENTTSSATAVSTILTGVGAADVDSGAQSGIAISASSGNGTWQYTTNGTDWHAVGTVSSGAALLLDASAQLRYVPDGANGETGGSAPALTFRAWDQTAGTSTNGAIRATADVTTNGGTTAYSSVQASASIEVTAVNDAPSLVSGTVPLTGTNENSTSPSTLVATILASSTVSDVDTSAAFGIAITGASGNGTWQYSTNGAAWTAFGTVSNTSALLLNSTTRVRLVGDGMNGGAATFTWRAWDRTSGTSSVNGAPSTADTSTNGGSTAFSSNTSTASLTVTSVNDAPTDISLSATSISQNDGVNAVVGTLSSTDVDSGDTFIYTRVAGIGDTDNTSFNISDALLRVNDAGVLAAGAYSVRIRTTDQGGLFYEKSFSITVEDNTAPVFQNSTPALTNINAVSTAVRVRLDEVGTAFYVVVANGAPAPTSAQVIAGLNNAGAAALASGSINVAVADTDYTAVLSGLTAGTAYDVYWVARDDESTPNVQTCPALVSLTTSTANALYFDADAKVTGLTGISPAAFTVEFNLFLDSETPPGNWQGIYWANNNNDTGIFIEDNYAVSLWTTQSTAYKSTLLLTYGAWNHVAISYSAGNGVRMYINGVLSGITQTGSPGAGVLPLTDVTVGYGPGIFGLPAGGYALGDSALEDFRIWNVERTAQEIIDNKDAELTPPYSANLVRYYDFNHGIGGENNAGSTTLIERTGNGANGTLVNFALNGNSSNWVKTSSLVSGPVVTDANISISGASGISGAYKIGDTVTATWNNTAAGDNNTDITGVTVNFSQFGGGSAVVATENSGTWTATYTIPAGDIDAANRNISVTATNTAGKSTTRGDTTNAVVDNIAPTVTDASISIAGATGNGGTYKIGDILTATWNNTVSGNNNSDIISGVTVDFSAFGGGTAVAATNSSGMWTATFALTAGTLESTGLNISVTATDNAGNTTTGADTSNATVDTSAPVISSVSVPTDGTYRAGESLEFRLNTSEAVVVDTTSGTPTISLTIGSTSQVATYVSGSSSPSALVFSYTVQAGDFDKDGISVGVLAPNAGTLRDAAGNNVTLTLNSIGSTTGVLVDAVAPTLVSLNPLDNAQTVAPSANLVITLSENIALGTGAIAIYDGQASLVTSINVTNHGNQLSIADATLTIDLAAELLEKAAYHVQIASGAITDLAGNPYAGIADNSTWNFTVADITPPVVSSVAVSGTPAANAATVPFTVTFDEVFTGARVADFVLTSTGSAAANITSVSSVGGNTLTVNIDNITGTGTLRLDMVANSGITDAHGNGNGTHGYVAAFTSGSVHTVDRDAPTAPSVPSLSSESDSGVSSSDGITNVTLPTFTGTAEASSTVELFRDGTISLGTTTASGSGNWTFTVSSALSEGVHLITARATDGAGNPGPASDALSVTIDTTAPATAVITAISEDTGSSDSDRITSDTTLILSGIGAANETVEVFRNTASIGTAPINTDGVWSYDYTATVLAAGTHTFTAKVTDVAGNTSAESAVFLVEIDTESPNAPVIVSMSEDTGTSATDGITKVNTLVLAGTADPLVTVTLSRSGTGIIGTTTSAADGVWTFDHSATPLADGPYLFNAFASDTAGNTGATSADFAVTIDAAAPVIVTQPAGGTADAKSTFVLTVVANDATALTYLWHRNGNPLSDSAQHSGATTATLTLSNIDPVSFSGNYTVVITDAAGNVTTSEPATLVVNKLAQTITFDAIGNKTRTAPAFTVHATASSALPVVFSVASGPATVTGNTVTLTGAPGLVTITAQQPGDAAYAAASPASRTFTVLADFSEPDSDGYASGATGGTGAQLVVTVGTAADFRLHAESSTPAIITVDGILNLGTTPVAVNSDKTIQGIDADAALIGNLHIGSGVRNVIIQGLNLSNPGTASAPLQMAALPFAAPVQAPAVSGDALTIAGARRVFITRCSFFDASDYAIRIIDGADEVTLSWNEFYYTPAHTGQRRSVLVGNSSGDFTAPRVSIHHNRWSTGVDAHIPLVHQGRVHFYNNIIESTGNTSATEVGLRGELLSERNLYQGVASPLAVASGGRAFVYENTYTGTTGAAPYAGNDPVFTPPHSYEALPVSDLTVVLAAAGNQSGGDYSEVVNATARINGPDTAIPSLSAFTLTAAPAGFTPSSYQWRLNNLPIPGANSATYHVTHAGQKDEGTYTVALTLASQDVIVSAPLVIAIDAQAEPRKLDIGGGGGSPSLWFFAAIAIAAVTRRMLRRRND